MPRVIWFDMKAREPQRAIQFYTRVFGWEFKKSDMPMDYWLIKTGSETPGIDGGLGRGDPVHPVVNTIGVDDLDATVEKIELNGGKVLSPRNPIPGVGWYAAFEDPSGNQFGIEQYEPSVR
jgi:predicted enzyme related to lactoylglutathione lyase